MRQSGSVGGQVGGVRVFADSKAGGCAHDAFQQWRQLHSDGLFLALRRRDRAVLHRALCPHPGSPYVLRAEVNGSLTRRMKVASDNPDALTAWARRSGVEVDSCKDCQPSPIVVYRSPVTPAAMTAFSWGYWGWGNSVPQLLAAVDATEASRGFLPPVFVDVRIQRSVRAIGFREAALAHAAGADRYHWMPELGNARVAARQAGIRIARPAAASLLDLVTEQAALRRRVIFFCACQFIQKHPCHRHSVSRILLRAAGRRGVSLSVEEWPGGTVSEEPVVVEDLRWTPRGRQTVRLGTGLPVPGLACLPWGSLVAVRTRSAKHFILSGPAHVRDGWRLHPLEYLGAGDEPPADFRSRAEAPRRRFRAGPFTA